jgi:hypothetical protein
MLIKQIQFQIEKSILFAEIHQSKLNEDILTTYGQSSYKIRHFLNNLLELPNANYLEIGLLNGSTFISSMYKT